MTDQNKHRREYNREQSDIAFEEELYDKVVLATITLESCRYLKRVGTIESPIYVCVITATCPMLSTEVIDKLCMTSKHKTCSKNQIAIGRMKT